MKIAIRVVLGMAPLLLLGACSAAVSNDSTNHIDDDTQVGSDTGALGCTPSSSSVVAWNHASIQVDLSDLDDLGGTATIQGTWYDSTQQSIQVSVSAVTNEVLLTTYNQQGCDDTYAIFVDSSITSGTEISGSGTTIQGSLPVDEYPEEVWAIREEDMSVSGSVATRVAAAVGSPPHDLEYTFFWDDGSVYDFEIRASSQSGSTSDTGGTAVFSQD